jgi:hypothetical protein
MGELRRSQQKGKILAQLIFEYAADTKYRN